MKSILAAIVLTFLPLISSAGVVTDNEVNTSQPLPALIADLNTLLGDNNITTGMTTMTYEQTSGITDLARDASATLFNGISSRDDGNQPSRLQVTTAEISYQNSVAEIGYDLAVGNANDLSGCARENAARDISLPACHNLADISEFVSVARDHLGAAAEVKVMRARANYLSDGEVLEVTASVFYNTRTKEAVRFFTIEGTM